MTIRVCVLFLLLMLPYLKGTEDKGARGYSFLELRRRDGIESQDDFKTLLDSGLLGESEGKIVEVGIRSLI